MKNNFGFDRLIYKVLKRSQTNERKKYRHFELGYNNYKKGFKSRGRRRKHYWSIARKHFKKS